ncbi:MAG: HAD hydrolase family protein [candidate division Zixibacteria bacterium]
MPTKKKYLAKRQLMERFKKVKALILDVDGVLTDDHIYMGPDGFELKKFHIGDGLSMVLAMRSGLEIMIMSNRPSPATTSRMKDLKIKHVIQAHGDKARIVGEYLKKKKLGFDLKQTVFIGNDIMDVTLAQAAGIGIAVASAHDNLIAVADYITKNNGGQGAVREIIELYFKAIGKKPVDYFTK